MALKGIVLYRTTYGSTQEYAGWIANKTGYKMESMQEFDTAEIENYDVIILGSNIIAGMLRGAKWIKKNWALLSSKKVFLYTVGGLDEKGPERMKTLSTSLSNEIIEAITIFHFRGRVNSAELKPLHRAVVKMVSRSPKEKNQASSFGNFDYVNKDYILPLLARLPLSEN